MVDESAAVRLPGGPGGGGVPGYSQEVFTAEQVELLARFFTNVDLPVFALVNLPEVVKGALFARYSRSPKSLRRLFLDEFADDVIAAGFDSTAAAPSGSGEAHAAKAAALYGRVFGQYGDDSVAQLGGAHVACEGVSNVLTKLLEWGRLASYLEQSTRYIAYTDRLGDGRWRYCVDADVDASPLGALYRRELDAMFAAYVRAYELMDAHLRTVHPNVAGDPPGVYAAAVRARALDVVRGMLPAAAVSNVGIYASGQAFEQLLVRLRASPLPEAQLYAQLLLGELRKVIPSFLTRVDRPDRGVVASRYLADTRARTAAVAAELLAGEAPAGAGTVQLVAFDADAELRMVAQMLYPHCALPLGQLFGVVRAMGDDERAEVVRAYVGERSDRRHKPGRALEVATYTFDVLADYGAFRDLQRHRMCSLEWQPLSPVHGYRLPAGLEGAPPEVRSLYEGALERSAALYGRLVDAGFVEQAPYAVALGYLVRFSITLNAREAMHLCELRSQPQGHISYRVVAQEMHRQIGEVAGHRAVAAAMSFVDRSGDGLGRLAAERRTHGAGGAG